VIILDEPTVGLDPRQIIEIRDLIQSLGKDHTVILSSHILSEVQAVCQTILIISKGKLVACDTPENLEKLFAGTATVELTVEATEEEVDAIFSYLPFVSEYSVKADGEGRCNVQFSADQVVDDSICRDTFFAFAKAERAILQMSMAKASLEDIFMELTETSDDVSDTDALMECADKPAQDADETAEEALAAQPEMQEQSEVDKE
jgi:ABC-2 type transport system ATP-binding protein